MAIHSDARAVDAVASLVDPTLATEIIVVNTGTGSLRHDLGAALEHVVLVESPAPRLPGGTRNLGLTEATGPIIGFLAADCLATPGWAARRIAAHHEAEAVASAILPAPAANGRVPLVSRAVHTLIYCRRDPTCPTAHSVRYGASYRRDVFARHGLFLEHRVVGEDTEFNDQLATPPIWEPGVVTLHRNPASVREAFADSWRRGARLQQWMATQTSRPTLRSLRWIGGGTVDAFSLLRHVPPQRRGGLLAALPLVWCLSLIRAGGALSGALRRRGTTTG